MAEVVREVGALPGHRRAGDRRRLDRRDRAGGPRGRREGRVAAVQPRHRRRRADRLHVGAEHGYDVAIQVDGDGQHPARGAAPRRRRAQRRGGLVIGSRFLDDGSYRAPSRAASGIRLFAPVLSRSCACASPTRRRASARPAATPSPCSPAPTRTTTPRSRPPRGAPGGAAGAELPVQMRVRQGGVSSITPFRAATTWSRCCSPSWSDCCGVPGLHRGAMTRVARLLCRGRLAPAAGRASWCGAAGSASATRCSGCSRAGRAAAGGLAGGARRASRTRSASRTRPRPCSSSPAASCCSCCCTTRP